jgi:hypothetical protein
MIDLEEKTRELRDVVVALEDVLDRARAIVGAGCEGKNLINLAAHTIASLDRIVTDFEFAETSALRRAEREMFDRLVAGGKPR